MATNPASPNVNDNDNTSAIPTFLAQDPFPSNNDDRPGTASSNGTSEFDGTKRSSVLSTTGPVGEPGLPPARPMSDAMSSQSWQRGGSRASTTMGGGGGAGAPASQRGSFRPFSRREGETSRPGSGMSGRTHVPTLSVQGFFRPLSSQQLQAQRGQNVAPPSSSRGHRLQGSVDEESDEHSNHRKRYSNASVNTAREIASRDGEAPPLPGQEQRGFSVATSSGGAPFIAGGPESVVSKNSTTPLHTRQHTNEKLQTTDSKPKSPRSLRNSLGWGSNKSKKDRNDQPRAARDQEKPSPMPASPNLNAKEREASPPKSSPTTSKAGKNYQYYAGNFLFFCLGRCLNTKAKPLNLATLVLTVLPAALFFGFSAPWLWHHVSPALPIVFAYIFFVTFSAFAHAALSDPGVLPRNLHPHPPNADEDRDPLTVGPPTTEWVMVKTFPNKQLKANLEAQAAENGSAGPSSATTAMEVPTKYCKTCNIWRPPRAHHCRVCDACIETQDHHCVWLNNCVGRRNYRFFFAYIGFGSIMALLLIAFSITHIATYASQRGISFGQALSGRNEERVAFAMFIYAVLALPYPGSLFGYHLFLIARGETTREYLNSHKFLPKDRHRPFSQSSMLKNWAAVLGRPRPPSYMSFKKAYQHGDIRMGHTMPKAERQTKAKLEAARSQSRVEGLKKRFSVPRNRVGQPQANGGAGHEMKELPPPPTADSGIGDNNAPAANGSTEKKRTLPGAANNTPR